MAENKKISELTRVSSLTGAEIVPFAKDGSNGAVSTAKLKEYAQPDLSAITTALGGKVDKVTGKGLSANDYTDDDKAKLTALPTSTQLTEKIDEAKLALFIDQWNAACGSYGKYNPANAPDAQHPFYLNHIWLTYKEAMAVMTAGKRQSSTLYQAYINVLIKTNLPRIGDKQAADAKETFRSCVYLETVEMPNLRLQGYVFFSCNQLRSVNWEGVPIYDLNNTANANFQGCSKLVELRGNLRSNFDFNIADSPLLSLASFQFMVNNAYNTAPITITVHPDVYAKLTGEQADATALLPENLLEDILNHSGGVTVIDGGIEISAAPQYVRFNHSPRLVDKGLGKLTVSCDVEGLNEGESITLLVGAENVKPRPRWTISANGRAVFSFDAAAYINDSTSQNGFLLYVPVASYTGQGLKLTNFKLSYGAYDTLPYTAPLSSVTDTELREKAEWLSLMQIAEARQINFVTTE